MIYTGAIIVTRQELHQTFSMVDTARPNQWVEKNSYAHMEHRNKDDHKILEFEEVASASALLRLIQLYWLKAELSS